MAEEYESSLIGYDPLAWMQQPAEKSSMPDAQQQAADPLEMAQDNAAEPIVESEWIESVDETSDWQDTVFESRSGPDVAQIVLEPVLSIQHVAALHERLMEALNTCNKIEIDASAVTTADTATLQLLLILKRSAINLQKEVVIDFPSERFVEAADLLGISEMLEVDRAAAGFF